MNQEASQVLKQEELRISPTIYQPNPITRARYALTEIEKNIFYLFLSKIKNFMPEAGTTLFTPGEMPISEVPFQVSELVGKDKACVNYEELKKALVLLQTRVMYFEKDVVEEQESQTRLRTIRGINLFSHIDRVIREEKGKKTRLQRVVMRIHPEFSPFIFEYVKGYTIFSLPVAMGLSGLYTKRLYEICCEFKNLGSWLVSVEELKKILSTPDAKSKYKNYAHFKSRVILPSYTQLKESYEAGESAVYFEFEEIKKKGSKAIEALKFIIISNPGRNAEITQQMKNEVMIWAMGIFAKTKDKKYLEGFISWLAVNEPQIPRLHHRLKKLVEDELKNGRELSRSGGLLRKILEEDYQYNGI